jgi:hypothetical protein
MLGVGHDDRDAAIAQAPSGRERAEWLAIASTNAGDDDGCAIRSSYRLGSPPAPCASHAALGFFDLDRRNLA